MGRKRIEIRGIESEEAHQVCFSKYRTILFKKASKLVTLCGVEVAVVVFSPSRARVCSFVHPSVEAIIEPFALTDLRVAAGGGAGDGEDSRQLAELNQQYDELRVQLDVEKDHVDKARRSARQMIRRWHLPLSNEHPTHNQSYFR